jgi:hypothetical protein
MDVAEFLDQHHADLSPVERAMAAAARDDAIAEADAKREKAARQEARETRAEALRFAFREHGDPARELQRQRAVLTEADDECNDLADKLRKADARRDRASNIEFFTTPMQEATALVQRSAPIDMLAPAKEALRQAAADDDVIRRARAAQARASRGRSPQLTVRSRPFGGGGHGEVNGAEVTAGRRAATHFVRPETYEELKNLPQGAMSRGGCPPCDGCGYVICRCPSYPDSGTWRSETYSQAAGQLITRVTPAGFVGVA